MQCVEPWCSVIDVQSWQCVEPCLQCVEPWCSVMWAMLAVCGTMVFSHVGYVCSVWNHGVQSCGLCLQCVEP